MAFSLGMSWNEGEERMHSLLRVPPQDNPTSAMLTLQASWMLQRGPLLALGTLDAQSRPWTTLWGGVPGFSEPLGGGLVGTKTIVDGKNDPVVQALVGDAVKGAVIQPKDGGKLLAGLAIDLMARKRVKICGRMVAGIMQEIDVESDEVKEDDESPKKQDRIQLITKIEQSMGNCPKYLNQYQLKLALVRSKLISEGPSLSTEGRALVNRADMFFLSTSTVIDQDTNHRGGPPGFVRTITSSQIIYPEYSGNRLYQSLGNLQINSKIGITFPDYETGDVLYITGTAEVLIGADAAKWLPSSNLAVKVDIDHSRFVQAGLPFRGVRKMPSPYNPRIRLLASEGNIKSTIATSSTSQTARLVKKTVITPSIARFTLSVANAVSYLPSQWVALDFHQDLDIGYDHMRENDPTSLNDDFVRTFTISSSPEAPGSAEKEFDITIRKVGPVTKFLFWQNDRMGLEIPLLGIGGDFKIEQVEGVTPFIAGGVGITPLLGQLKTLNISPEKFKLFWTLRGEDFELAVDVLQKHPQLTKCTKLFLTGGMTSSHLASSWMEKGVKIEERRMVKGDLDVVDAERWYLCAGKAFRAQVLGWLEGKTVIFENFDY